jgi:hypothetical protein
MTGGIDLATVAMAAVFVLLILLSVRRRRRVLEAVARLPEAERERLGWHLGDDVAPRRHVRLVTRRLLLRGLPERLPLAPEARRDLAWHRVSGFAAIGWLTIVLPLAWGSAWLVTPMVAGTAAVLALQGWLDGPWGGGR